MSGEKIKIALSEKRLYLFRSESFVQSYPVAVGKPTTPTPLGDFAVFEKVINPGGILGTRWLGFHIVADGKYGIHGTNNPNSIGREISNGCVRMFNQDVEAIFPQVSVGTPVTILRRVTELQPPLPGAPAPAPEERIYVVQAGDSLWTIAGKFGVTLGQLISRNHLTDPAMIYPGQTLIIP